MTYHLRKLRKSWDLRGVDDYRVQVSDTLGPELCSSLSTHFISISLSLFYYLSTLEAVYFGLLQARNISPTYDNLI